MVPSARLVSRFGGGGAPVPAVCAGLPARNGAGFTFCATVFPPPSYGVLTASEEPPFEAGSGCGEGWAAGAAVVLLPSAPAIGSLGGVVSHPGINNPVITKPTSASLFIALPSLAHSRPNPIIRRIEVVTFHADPANSL